MELIAMKNHTDEKETQLKIPHAQSGHQEHGAWDLANPNNNLTEVGKELFTELPLKENRIQQLQRWVNLFGTPPKEKSLFSQILNGKASFGEKLARRLERDYDMGLGYLDLKNSQPQNTPGNQVASITQTDLIELKLYDISASCGGGRFNSNYPNLLQNISFTHEAALEMFGTTNLKNVAIVPPDGDSMEPTIPQKSIAFMKTDIQEFVSSGIYYFNFQGADYIKRLFISKGNVIKVSSDNEFYRSGDFDILPEEQDQLHIYGKLWKVMPISILDL